MTDFLHKMAATSAARATKSTVAPGERDFQKPVVPLTLGDFDIIAEIKERSPAEGRLGQAMSDRVDRARKYAAGGAAAISVLTEPSRFAGSLAHLREVAASVPNTPVMRKDFLVRPVQVVEARAAGASGVLLIAALLDDATLRDMLDLAYELGLFVLLESFDAGELERCARLLDGVVDRDAADQGRLLFGLNTRNLRTLEVDRSRLERLAPQLPSACCVAESGLRTPGDAATVAALGYRAALVGSALMQSFDPAGLVRAMRDAGSASIAA